MSLFNPTLASLKALIRIVAAAEDLIGTNEFQPSGCISSVRLQTRGEPIDHTPDEGLPFLRAHSADSFGVGS